MESSEDYLPIEKIECYIGAKIKILGIVSEVRNQGGLIFIDIKDGNNSVQALIIPDNVSAYKMAQEIAKGYLVEIRGSVKECPASIQEMDVSRKTEIDAEQISIISARSEKENESRGLLNRSKILSLKNKKKII